MRRERDRARANPVPDWMVRAAWIGVAVFVLAALHRLVFAGGAGTGGEPTGVPDADPGTPALTVPIPGGTSDTPGGDGTGTTTPEPGSGGDESGAPPAEIPDGWIPVEAPELVRSVPAVWDRPGVYLYGPGELHFYGVDARYATLGSRWEPRVEGYYRDRPLGAGLDGSPPPEPIARWLVDYMVGAWQWAVDSPDYPVLGYLHQGKEPATLLARWPELHMVAWSGPGEGVADQWCVWMWGYVIPTGDGHRAALPVDGAAEVLGSTRQFRMDPRVAIPGCVVMVPDGQDALVAVSAEPVIPPGWVHPWEKPPLNVGDLGAEPPPA